MNDKGKLSATTSGETAEQRGRDVPEVYGVAAPDYFRAGWQPLPLPPGQKHAPPSGYTGAEGKMIGSIQTIRQWAKNPRVAAGNVGLHLLHPFVGIDVDTHGEGDDAKVGATTLAAAEADLGALPPTLISSARPDPLVSGIRIFRLPEGTPRLTPGAEGLLTGRFGPDIDVISQAYRYIVVAPSTNPDAGGAPYRWYVQHEVYEDGSGGQVEPLDGVPDFSVIATLPQAWADLLTSDSRAEATALDPARAQARAQAVEKALGSAPSGPSADPFDPDDAELLDLDIDVADAATRLYSRERAEAEVADRLALVRASRRGRINHTLKDAVTFLWHFVPHFLTQQQAVDLLLDAQRDAWVRSGGKDDGDYSGAMQTINHTVNTYIPTQIKFGQWWVAVPDEDDEGNEGETEGKAQVGAPVEADPDEDDPTEIDEWDGPSASRSSSAGSAPSAASSGRDDVSEADRADIEATARLREQRRAEKAAKVEAEQLAQMLTAERMRRKAKAMIDEEEANRQADEAAVAALMSEFITAADLDEIPPPEWLVGGDPHDANLKGAGLFYRETVARVVGAGGTYKTFMMLSIASMVARGLPWFGFSTRPGPVVYVMAESKSGAAQRVRAFEKLYGLHPTRDLHVITRPVHMTGPEWPAFVAACKQLGAVMIVLDTQAKMTTGLEENSATDTGKWVAAAERLRRETEACVVLVHHTGHGNSGRGRGSSAAYAGIDTEVMVEPDGERVLKYKVVRQKETSTGQTGRLQMVDSGESIAVALVDAETETREQRAKAMAASLDMTALAADNRRDGIARVLAGVFSGGLGATKAELIATYNEKLRDLGKLEAGKTAAKTPIYKALTELQRDGHFEYNPKLSARFVLSREGCKAIGEDYVPPAWAAEDDDDLGVGESVGGAGVDPADALRGAIGSGGTPPWDDEDDIEFD
jgi:hypothetical protein